MLGEGFDKKDFSNRNNVSVYNLELSGQVMRGWYCGSYDKCPQSQQ